MTQKQYLKVIESIIKSPRNDLQKIDMLKQAFELYVAEHEEKATMDKIYKTVEQECSGCGNHFYLKYCSDGSYEYIGKVCTCLATFHPVDGEPSFGQWINLIKE